jgi:hypothetical protein
MKKMKKLIVLAALGLLGTALWAQAAELSFDYKQQRGAGSNQFVIWVEDAAGNYIKTLYATNFTADGGWERRPTSLPVWVKKSGLAKMPRSQIDALTGATPEQGKLSYRWDFTDSKGAKVAPGKYKIILEATLKNENQALYSADIQTGTALDASPVPQYSGTGTAERGMISGVRVKVTN